MSVRHGWWKKVAAEVRAAVKEAAESHAGHPAVLAFILGNEITDPVARWHARRRVDDLLRSLFETDKVAAPKALFSCANYPRAPSIWIPAALTASTSSSRTNPPTRYVALLRVSTRDRPLLLTELGLESGGGEHRQADSLDW
jgi:O-antigen biosynthesis protein